MRTLLLLCIAALALAGCAQKNQGTSQGGGQAGQSQTAPPAEPTPPPGQPNQPPKEPQPSPGEQQPPPSSNQPNQPNNPPQPH
jgi:hypothetical protein